MSDHSERWKYQRMPLNHGWWKQIKNSIYERDGVQCRCCGSSRRLTVDHIIPLTWGGTNSLANLQLLCKLCHNKKTRRERAWLGLPWPPKYQNRSITSPRAPRSH
jgi:5-methylcytosine-specific restriction endonuclease McrA